MRITEISSLKKQKNLHESIAADSKPLEPTGTEVQKNNTLRVVRRKKINKNLTRKKALYNNKTKPNI